MKATPLRQMLGGASLLLATPAWANLGGASDTGPSLWRVGAVFILCLVLALVSALALRAKLGGGFSGFAWRRAAEQRRLKLVESIRVTPQVQLCIVSCGEREMLLSTSPTGAQLLCELQGSSAGAGD